MVIVTVKSVQIDQVLRIVPSTMYVLANIIIITMYYFTVNNSKQFLNMRWRISNLLGQRQVSNVY